MQVRELADPDLQILAIEGDIDLAVSPELRLILQDKAEERPPALLLDISGVGFLDSSGLATMVDYVRKAQEFGGRLALVGATERVRTVIQIVRLHEFLPMHATVSDAKAALALAEPSA